MHEEEKGKLGPFVIDLKGEPRPQCRQCQHVRRVPGSAHVRCGHPEVKEDGFSQMMAYWGIPDPNQMVRAGVLGHERGIRSGWFAWPFNFDPTWLLSCDWFQESETGEVRG